MKRSILGLVLFSSLAFSGELNYNQKVAVKYAIEDRGYVCNVVTTAYKTWDDKVKVVCDDYNSAFMISQYGGRLRVEVVK